MDITPETPQGHTIINAYSDDGFTISDKKYVGSMILLPTKADEISITAQDPLTDNLLDILSHYRQEIIEVLLIGTGPTHRRLDNRTRQKIKALFPLVSIDEMTTTAACRTFNILTLEDRKVCTILIL